jgi:hypothetical protein
MLARLTLGDTVIVKCIRRFEFLHVPLEFELHVPPAKTFKNTLFRNQGLARRLGYGAKKKLSRNGLVRNQEFAETLLANWQIR